MLDDSKPILEDYDYLYAGEFMISAPCSITELLQEALQREGPEVYIDLLCTIEQQFPGVHNDYIADSCGIVHNDNAIPDVDLGCDHALHLTPGKIVDLMETGLVAMSSHRPAGWKHLPILHAIQDGKHYMTENLSYVDYA